MSAIDGDLSVGDYRVAHKEAPYFAEWYCLNDGMAEAIERSAIKAAHQGTPQMVHFHKKGQPCRRLAPGRDCLTYRIPGLPPIYRHFQGR